MNRVQRFAEGDGKKRNNVGFALAESCSVASPRHRQPSINPSSVGANGSRTELGEARLAAKGRKRVRICERPTINARTSSSNLEEYGQEEIDELEDLIATGATTAETVEQLALEVETLKGLESHGAWRPAIRASTPSGPSSIAFWMMT